MTADIVIEKIMAAVKDKWWNPVYVYSVMDSLRAGAIVEYGKTNKNVPYQIYQNYEVDFDANIQNSQKYEVFYLLRSCPLNSTSVLPVEIRGTNGKALSIYGSQTDRDIIAASPYSKSSDPYAIIEGGAEGKEYVKIFNAHYNTLSIRQLIAEPLKAKWFNPIYDDYPVTEGLLPFMEAQALQLHLQWGRNKRTEISDSENEIQTQPVNR